MKYKIPYFAYCAFCKKSKSDRLCYTLNAMTSTEDRVCDTVRLTESCMLCNAVPTMHLVSRNALLLSRCIAAQHNASCHVMSCHIMPYHITSYHIMSYHVMSYHVMPYHIISCHAISTSFCSPLSRMRITYGMTCALSEKWKAQLNKEGSASSAEEVIADDRMTQSEQCHSYSLFGRWG